MDVLEGSYPGGRLALKRQILNCALQESLQSGIAATTIEMIRDRAETSVGAIYHHFHHKDGIVAALYLAALKDQSSRRLDALSQAKSAEQGIHAIIRSYIDWVISYPDFARFLYAAHHVVHTSELRQDLEQRTSQRNQNLKKWLAQQSDAACLQAVPPALLTSLVIGATESYCHAWLAGRVKDSPQKHAAALAQSVWDPLQHFSR